MTEQSPKPVVVAVGHDPIDAALAFAAGEAERAGCGLHLVHVVHVLVQDAETAHLVTDLERAGRQLLDDAVDRARKLVDDAAVTSEQRVGSVVPTIIDMARDARLIVLQHRDLSTLMRVVTRSSSSGVASRAHVPVVSVPAAWTPEGAGDRDVPVITVGVDVAERAEWVLRAAATEAKERGGTIRALHRWYFPAYDDVVISPTGAEEWRSRAVREVQHAIDALGDDIAGIPVEIEARQAHPAAALIEASRSSDLLVLGRHDRLLPFGSHLGPIAGAVLRESACPVMLVDPRPPQASV